MARFHCQLRNAIAGPFAVPLVSLRTLEALNLVAADDECDDAAQGPGWFDSSWDLTRGLEVHEGLPGDARLHEWLAVCLHDARSASAPARRHEQHGAILVPVAAHGAFVDAAQRGDLGLAVAIDVARLDAVDEFGEFGIEGLELL